MEEVTRTGLFNFVQGLGDSRRLRREVSGVLTFDPCGDASPIGHPTLIPTRDTLWVLSLVPSSSPVHTSSLVTTIVSRASMGLGTPSVVPYRLPSVVPFTPVSFVDTRDPGPDPSRHTTGQVWTTTPCIEVYGPFGVGTQASSTPRPG